MYCNCSLVGGEYATGSVGNSSNHNLDFNYSSVGRVGVTKALIRHTQVSAVLSINITHSTPHGSQLATIPLMSLNRLIMFIWWLRSFHLPTGKEQLDKCLYVSELIYCVVSVLVVSISWGMTNAIGS